MSRRRRLGSEGGFTLIELMLAVVIGVIVMIAATGLALVTGRSLAGSRLRDGISRNARFIGLSMQRDLQEAGVGMSSTATFGTVGVWNDTLIILRQVYTAAGFPPQQYVLQPPAGVNNPLAAGGTCGATCLDLKNLAQVPAVPFQLAVGDLAVLQVNTNRRLLYITGANGANPTAQITFNAVNPLLHHDAAFSGGLLLDRFSSNVTEINMVSYWRDAQNNLLRAQTVNAAGVMQGEIVATGVQIFDVSLVFTNGVELTQADGLNADPNDNYDDLASVHVRATVQAEGIDPRVAGGVLLTKQFDWWFTPRNLMYERNAIGP